jgi:hypothetical protein
MASVKIVGSEITMKKQVWFTINAVTSVGQTTFGIRVEDHGSTSQLEKAAFRKALILAEEIATELRRQLGP